LQSISAWRENMFLIRSLLGYTLSQMLVHCIILFMVATHYFHCKKQIKYRTIFKLSKNYLYMVFLINAMDRLYRTVTLAIIYTRVTSFVSACHHITILLFIKIGIHDKHKGLYRLSGNWPACILYTWSIPEIPDYHI